MGDMIDRDAALAIVERGEFVYHNIAALPAVTVGVKQLREAFDAGQDHGWDQGKTDACGGPEPVSNDEAFAAFLAALEPQPAPDAAAMVDPACDQQLSGNSRQLLTIGNAQSATRDAQKTVGVMAVEIKRHEYKLPLANWLRDQINETLARYDIPSDVYERDVCIDAMCVVAVDKVERDILTLITEKPHDRA